MARESDWLQGPAVGDETALEVLNGSQPLQRLEHLFKEWRATEDF